MRPRPAVQDRRLEVISLAPHSGPTEMAGALGGVPGYAARGWLVAAGEMTGNCFERPPSPSSDSA
jgi:hypothetical protein